MCKSDLKEIGWKLRVFLCFHKNLQLLSCEWKISLGIEGQDFLLLLVKRAPLQLIMGHQWLSCSMITFIEQELFYPFTNPTMEIRLLLFTLLGNILSFQFSSDSNKMVIVSWWNPYYLCGYISLWLQREASTLLDLTLCWHVNKEKKNT